jgi:RNA polymerase sigma-B factor
LYFRPGDDASLLHRYHEMGDPTARDELVGRYLPLVRRLARRYSYTSEPLDDLCQVGAMALCKAIDRYRPGAGASFKAYAMPTIVGELRRHFRDTGWALHIPRPLQERARALGAALGTLGASLGRSPTIAELAEETGMSREDVIEGLEVRMAYDTTSLDDRGAGEEDAAWLTQLGAEDAGYERAELHAVIDQTLRSLPARERLLVHLRFSEDLSQSEIARRMGLSQMHVSRLLRRAIGQLEAVAGGAPAESRFGAYSAG